jgi:prevent-host-death family protein
MKYNRVPSTRSAFGRHRHGSAVPRPSASATLDEWSSAVTRMLPRWARVTIFLVMSDTLPLAEVKAKFSEMVDRVEHQHDRITVTRNGRPAAVLVSPDDLASLEETLELLSNPDAVAEIERARAEVRAGKVVRADELRAKYLTT